MNLGGIVGITKKSVEENYEKMHTSECIVRKMTPKERERYFGKESKKVASKSKVTKDRLFDLCKEHGTDWQAAKRIGQEIGLTPQTIVSNIKAWGVDRKLEQLKNEPIEAIEVEEMKTIEPVLTISTDDMMPRIVYAEYKIGRLTVGISYDEELIGFDQAEGITFEEALNICEFLKETL